MIAIHAVGVNPAGYPNVIVGALLYPRPHALIVTPVSLSVAAAAVGADV